MAACGFAPAAWPAISTAPSASQPVGRVVEFQPHVRIDYRQRQVEVDAKVTTREGALELFACSPGTREYESIVVAQTRPLFVFQALGLLGLTPGHPLRLSEDGRLDPADGEPVEILVRYGTDGAVRTVPIETWMRHAETTAPLDRQPWVFAGSLPIEGGAIAADEEGTLVAVVDFESAVVALPRQHTASNAELWLEPNTSAIPPVDTPCTLIFRPGPWRLHLDETGRLSLSGKPVTFTEAVRRLRAVRRENPSTHVEVEVAPDGPADDRARLRDLLHDLGIQPVERTTSRPSTGPSAQSRTGGDDNTALLRWVAGQLSATGR